MTRTIRLEKMGWAVAVLTLAISAAGAAVPNVDVDRLWNSVEQLASVSTRGHEAVVDAWPGQQVSARSEGSLGFDGGEFPISGPLRVSKSDIRLDGSGKLVLVSLDVTGACVTPADLKKRYPYAETLAWPQPGNPNPYSYELVEFEGAQLSFGFPDLEPRCLFNVVVKPQLAKQSVAPTVR